MVSCCLLICFMWAYLPFTFNSVCVAVGGVAIPPLRQEGNGSVVLPFYFLCGIQSFPLKAEVTCLVQGRCVLSP